MNRFGGRFATSDRITTASGSEGGLSERRSRTLFYAQPYRTHKRTDVAPTFVPKTWKMEGWYNTKPVNEKWRNPCLHPRPFINYDHPKRTFLKRSITPPWPKTYKQKGNRNIRPPDGPPSRKYRWESRITHEVNKRPAKVVHKMVTTEKRRDPWGCKMDGDEGGRGPNFGKAYKPSTNSTSAHWEKAAQLHEILTDVKGKIAAKAKEDAQKRQAALLKSKELKRPTSEKNHRKDRNGVGKCETHLGSKGQVEFALSVDATQQKSRASRNSGKETSSQEEGSRSGGAVLTSDYPPGTVLKLTPKLSAGENQRRKMHNLRKGRPAEEKLYVPIDEHRHFVDAPTSKRVAVGETKFDKLPKPLKRHIQKSLLEKGSDASLIAAMEKEAEEEAELTKEEKKKGPDKRTIDRLSKPKHKEKKPEYQGYLPPVLTRMERKILPTQVAPPGKKKAVARGGGEGGVGGRGGGGGSGGKLRQGQGTKLPPVVKKKEKQISGRLSGKSKHEPQPSFAEMEKTVRARDEETYQALATKLDNNRLKTGGNRNATGDTSNNAEIVADAYLEEISASVVANAMRGQSTDGNWTDEVVDATTTSPFTTQILTKTEPEKASTSSASTRTASTNSNSSASKSTSRKIDRSRLQNSASGNVVLPPIDSAKDKAPSKKRRHMVRLSSASRPKEVAPRIVVERPAFTKGLNAKRGLVSSKAGLY